MRRSLKSWRHFFALKWRKGLRYSRYFFYYRLPFRFKPYWRQLKQPFSLLLLLFLFLLGFSYYFLADFLVELVYDLEIATLFSREALILLIALPAFLITSNLLLLGRIIYNRLIKKPGSLLRFRIITFFFFSFLIPCLVLPPVFSFLFDTSITIFDNRVLLDNLETSLANLNGRVAEKQRQHRALLTELLTNELPLNAGLQRSEVDFLVQYNQRGVVMRVARRAGVSILSYPQFDWEGLFSKPKSGFFSSYQEREGLVYTIYRAPTATLYQYTAAFSYLPPAWSKRISETLSLIKELKQFDLLLDPFKDVMLFVFIYLYLQVFSLMTIFFYYRSSSYISPLEALIRATKDISLSGRSAVDLQHHLRRMPQDEMRHLLQAFSSMERELRQNRRRIAHLSRVEAWQEVAVHLAHELKNPLTPITVATNEIENQLLKKAGFEAYEKLHPSFNLIYQSVKQIEALVGDFFDYSKETPLKLTRFSLRKLFEALQHYLAHHKELTFKWFFLTRQLYCWGDRQKLEQVLINLVQNSINSLQQVRSSTSAPVPFSKTILVVVSEGRKLQENKVEQLKLKVIDNGVGLSPSRLENIFNPYVTYRKRGLGMGLSVCRKLVQAHQGEITAYLKEARKELAGLGRGKVLEQLRKENRRLMVFQICLPKKNS